MLRETVKQEIDTLDEGQLVRIADFITSIKGYSQPMAENAPYWKHATATERSEEFRAWVAGLPITGTDLADEAFDRATIYE